MHSVLVLGDVRSHMVRLSPKSVHSGAAVSFRGGAILMADAIRKALHEHAEWIGDSLAANVFSFEDVPDVGFDYREWEMVLSTKGKYRLALHRKAKVADILPKVSDELFYALRVPGIKNVSHKKTKVPEGYFDEPNLAEPNREPMPWCPDVIVIDDLDGPLRKKPTTADLGKVYSSIPGLKSLAAKSKSVTDPFDLAVDIICKRLCKAANYLRAKRHECLIEPVIILSVAGKLPNISLDASTRLGPTIFECLYGRRELRERTIVLLDVEDLRLKENLSISIGLSWERTAQETIVALHGSSRGRLFLDFGLIIVRYGVTGALLITKTPSGWVYRLFFDPHSDESTNSNVELNHQVLGQTAIFTASLVQSLMLWCTKRRRGHPLLLDMPEAVREALPIALQRCNRLLETGYGESEDIALDKDKFMEMVVPNHLFEPYREMPAISEAIVPELRSLSWSFLSQAAQNRVGPLVKKIVLSGVDSTFCNQAPTQEYLLTTLVHRLANQHMDLAILWSSSEKDIPAFTKSLMESGSPLAHTRSFIIGELKKQIIKDSQSWLHPLDSGLNCRWQEILNGIIKYCKKYVIIKGKSVTVGTDGAKELARELFKSTTSVELAYVHVDGLEAFHKNILNAPVFQLGDKGSYVIDRREIEGMRTIGKLILSYLKLIADEPDKQHKPLCFAVFGPPGAGKSSAVRGIINSITDSPAAIETLLPFNLSQSTNSDDLNSAFSDVTNWIAKRKVPIAFFDEFDSRYGDVEWGWLKFFLAPMEDGIFRGKPTHNSIFVFAGGTSHTFADFSLANRNPTDPQIQKFSTAKGPDFVSRLSGYLDIIGVNPADAADDLYLLRRAIVMRSMIEAIQKLNPSDKASIDEDILNAILFVPKYKDGARSLRRMLELCSRDFVKDGRKLISNSSVPPIQQLNMLTDGKAILDLLANISKDPSGNSR